MSQPIAVFTLRFGDTEQNNRVFDEHGDLVETSKRIKEALEDMGFDSVSVQEA